MRRLLLGCLVCLAVAGPAAASHDTYAGDLAEGFWRNSRSARLRIAEHRLQGYLKREDWPHAVALCDKLLPDVPPADDGRSDWRVATA